MPEGFGVIGGEKAEFHSETLSADIEFGLQIALRHSSNPKNLTLCDKTPSSGECELSGGFLQVCGEASFFAPWSSEAPERQKPGRTAYLASEPKQIS